MGHSTYPWYTVTSGGDLEQGDILTGCPVFRAPEDLSAGVLERARSGSDTPGIRFDFQTFDVIVLSQTCDLVNKKLRDVLLCPLFTEDDFERGQTFSRDRDWENARQGRYPAYHVVSACEIPEFESKPRIIDFKSVVSLPVGFLRNFAVQQGPRVRLMPPYREHLSQSFARFFMRVGLPVDIPSFIK